MRFVVAFALAVALTTTATLAEDTKTVDLRGKKGVVDPKDLKKDDPKPPKVEKAPPPPPEKKPDVPPYEVKKSHEGHPGNNPTNK